MQNCFTRSSSGLNIHRILPNPFWYCESIFSIDSQRKISVAWNFRENISPTNFGRANSSKCSGASSNHTFKYFFSHYPRIASQIHQVFRHKFFNLCKNFAGTPSKKKHKIIFHNNFFRHFFLFRFIEKFLPGFLKLVISGFPSGIFSALFQDLFLGEILSRVSPEINPRTYAGIHSEIPPKISSYNFSRTLLECYLKLLRQWLASIAPKTFPGNLPKGTQVSLQDYYRKSLHNFAHAHL